MIEHDIAGLKITIEEKMTIRLQQIVCECLKIVFQVLFIKMYFREFEEIIFEIAFDPAVRLLLPDSEISVKTDCRHNQIRDCRNRFVNPDTQNLDGRLYEFQKHGRNVSVIIVICCTGYSQSTTR